MTAQLIDTQTMPGDDMSPGLIEAAATNFRSVGKKVSTRGGTLETDWQKLSAVYEAPESDDLTQAMGPAKKKTDAINSDMKAAAKALDTFADQVRVIKAAVATIRTDAATFLRGVVDGKVAGGYYGGGEIYSEPREWHTDPASVDTNNALIRRANDQQEALEAAERACATSVRATVGLAPVSARSAANPDGYGSTDIPDDAPMPWGAASGRTEGCVDHISNGFLIDGLVGLAADAGTLAGFSRTADDCIDWSPLNLRESGLGVLSFAVGATTFGPGGWVAGHTIPGPVGKYLRDSQFMLPAAVASLGAVDLYAKDPLHKWRANPARAGGETAFNVATFGIGALKTTKFRRPDHDGSGPSTITKPATPSAPPARVFTSGDAHVAGVATDIEKAFPGRVVDVNNQRLMKDGLKREVDVDLGNIIIQVKGDKARNIARQILKTEATTGVRTIGYAPDIAPGAWRDAAARGVVIVRSKSELLDYLREFG